LNRPFELLPIFRERVWGRTSLAPLFPGQLPLPDRPDNSSIGEVWFTFRENQTSFGPQLGELLEQRPELLGTGADSTQPGVCPILVKLLFTSERLSVQVHPDDSYARTHHQSLGKTEAWYVLDAQPPAEIAIGFREPLTAQRFRQAIQSGEIEELLDWRKVKAGDVIFVPAGTVHAIGAGLTVCEIQENSDITYRLYDYGRPRELHIEHGAKVSHLGPYHVSPNHVSSNNDVVRPVSLANGRDQLLVCEYFRIERLQPRTAISFEGKLPYYSVLICTRGSGMFDGQPCRAGQAWFVPANSSALSVDAPDSEWILAYKAAEPARGIQLR
jgi:mannose-6-phosphate isomerase